MQRIVNKGIYAKPSGSRTDGSEKTYDLKLPKSSINPGAFYLGFEFLQSAIDCVSNKQKNRVGPASDLENEIHSFLEEIYEENKVQYMNTLPGKKNKGKHDSDQSATAYHPHGTKSHSKMGDGSAPSSDSDSSSSSSSSSHHHSNRNKSYKRPKLSRASRKEDSPLKCDSPSSKQVEEYHEDDSSVDSDTPISQLVKAHRKKANSSPRSTTSPDVVSKTSKSKMVTYEPIPAGVVTSRTIDVVKHEYQHIRTNVYVHRKRHKLEFDEVNVCTCVAPSLIKQKREEALQNTADHPQTPTSSNQWFSPAMSSFAKQGCGERCINRKSFSECLPQFCKCGTECTNQFFSKRKYCRLTMYYSPMKGWGIKAAQDISKGTFVIEYVGEVITLQEAELRRINKPDSSRHYIMSLSATELIDATYRGNIARFINHSCDPNCECQKWITGSEHSVGIFASRDIKEGEELTFDYSFERLGGEMAAKCHCGSEHCCSVIGKLKESSSNNHLPLKDRMTKLKVYDVDMITDPGDQTRVPITLLPGVCKQLSASIVNHLNSMTVEYSRSDIIKAPPQLNNHRESLIESVNNTVLNPCVPYPHHSGSDNESEPQSQSCSLDDEVLVDCNSSSSVDMVTAQEVGSSSIRENDGFEPMVSHRGVNNRRTNGLMLNRNFRRGFSHFSWVYDHQRGIRMGIVDPDFKKLLLKNDKYRPFFD